MVVLINWDKPSWNVLLSCSLIGQLCVGGPDYSNCTVNSHAGIGIIVKKLILWCLLPLLRLLEHSSLDYVKRFSTNLILMFTSLCRCYVFFWSVTFYVILIIWVLFSFLSSLSQTGNKLEWSFVCSFNTDKQSDETSLTLKVCKLYDWSNFSCTNLYKFFFHVIFYVIKHYIFVSFSFMSLYCVTWHMIIHVFKSSAFAKLCFDSTEQ